MHRLIITKPAEKHLEAIAKWTKENWGEGQVENYQFDLSMGLLSIIENPKIGKDASALRENLRVYHVERHLVYYEIQDMNIIVHAFLGEGQKAELHL